MRRACRGLGGRAEIRVSWTRRLSPALLIGALAVTRCGGAPAPAPPAAAATERGDTATRGGVTGPFAFAVTTRQAAETTVPRRVRVHGKVVAAPRGKVQVTAPASGFVSYTGHPPRTGQAVRQGDTLAIFQYQYELHDAVHLLNERWIVLRELLEAERERARTLVDYERLQEVAKTDGASRAEVKAAETRWRVAAADQQTWTRRLALQDQQIQASEPNRQPLVAPITGTIAETATPQGQLVHEGDPLFTLVDLTDVWIEGLLPVADANWVNAVTTARITVPGSDEAPRPARLRAVAPAVDGGTRTLRVQFSMPNPGALLRFDMSVDLELERGETYRAVTVPASALLKRDQQTFVFLRVAPEQYVLRAVRVLADDPETTPVDGLHDGDEVVVAGQQQLWTILEQGPGIAVRTDAQ